MSAYWTHEFTFTVGFFFLFKIFPLLVFSSVMCTTFDTSYTLNFQARKLKNTADRAMQAIPFIDRLHIDMT